MEKMKIAGITGTYCAGKNHVALILEKRGFPVLDLDKLGHQVIETEKDRILARFGEDIRGEDGLINRKKLGAKVFGNPEELAALEGIIHPAVNRETLDWINSRKEKACFINAALLHRSSALPLLDVVIIVDAPVQIRMLRAKLRDGLPWKELFLRFQSQREFTSQYFKQETDIYRVYNSSGLATSGFFSMGKVSRSIVLENRISEILSLEGIT